MAKINKEEYEVLKNLDDEWKWIARDATGDLYKYQNKPKRVNFFKWNDRNQTWLGMSNRTFQFISWEDEEPYNIAELIEEYEVDYLGSWEHAVEFSEEIRKESEETEVKEDLKEAILGIEVTQFDGQKADLEELLNPEELEKIISDWMPEVLSQEWIDENSFEADNWNEVVHVDKLQNLLVPKQELPVIPKFVAEWIEESKPYLSLRVAFEYIAQGKKDSHDDEQLAFWVEEGNSETFARAWLTYPNIEVEKEKKYRVKDKNVFMLFKLDGKVVPTAEHFIVSTTCNIENDLTEQEIKDYDERYWAFAVPVEEEEE